MELNISIKNYKSIKNINLALKPGLNILIGANGAGKTCILSGLKFIRDILFRGAALAVAKGGGQVRNYHRGTKKMQFIIEIDYGERVFQRRKRPAKVIWKFSIAQKGSERIAVIVHESISIVVFRDKKKFTPLEIYVDRSAPSRPKYQFKISPIEEIGKNFFSRWDGDTSNNKKVVYEEFKIGTKKMLARLKQNGDKSILLHFAYMDTYLMRLIDQFASLNEFNIIPDLAREATDQLPYAKMQPDGSGLSEVLDALINKNYHKIQSSDDFDSDFGFFGPGLFREFRHYLMHRSFIGRRRINKMLHDRGEALNRINQELAAGVRPIEKVSVKIDQNNGKRFVIFHSKDHKFYPQEVSDGTIKWLSILVSIFVGLSKTYLIEEPENFLHPWMQQKLIELMRQQAELDETIFLMTTHSVTILNATLPRELIIVNPSEEGTRANHVKNEKEILNFLANSDFGLGDLWVSGGLGGTPVD